MPNWCGICGAEMTTGGCPNQWDHANRMATTDPRDAEIARLKAEVERLSGGAVSDSLTISRLSHALSSEREASRVLAERLQWVRENIRVYWSFDSNQQHTHNWHSREDFITEMMRQIDANPIARSYIERAQRSGT